MKKIKIRSKKNKTEKPKKKIGNIILSFILACGITVVSLLLVFALYIIITSPDFDKEKLYSKESSVLYYKDGKTELARLGNYDRVLVSYNELPEVLVDAIVATEDSRFFQHSGMDMARFLKATAGQLLGKSWAGGASTLTMQIVKKTYTSSESDGIEGIVRKFKDIYMSVFKIESNYTKEEIIEFYVNSQWFAHDGNLNYGGIAGVEQACQYFFGKSVSDISLAEASLIAGMFQNPRYYNPYTYPERIKKRQKTVLALMVKHGYITEEEQNAVLSIPIESLLQPKEASNNSNQAAIDYIINDVRQVTGFDPSTTAMKIVTTIDPNIQEVLNQLERGEIYEFPNEYLQEGIAITNTTDGSITALSGGRNYSAKGTHRAIEKRQPGSTAKILFDYGPYLEYIEGSSPSTLFLDEETTYSNGTPIKNADGKYSGLMTMRDALVNSRNIPALRAFKEVYAKNPDYIKDFVHNLGINYGEELFESASIGGFEGISPVQMSAAYAAYGRGGYYIEPYSFTKVTILESGKEINNNPEKKKVMSAETAYMITDMLISASKSGVGGVSVSGTEIAAKSGTSNVDRTAAEKAGIPTSATRDAWNVTYTSEYSIALWTGYDSTTKEHYLTVNLGSKARNAIMKAVGSRVYSKNQTFQVPSGLISVEIEKETIPNQLPSDYTPDSLKTTEIFKEGTEPTETSTRFESLEAPTNGKYTFDGKTIKLIWDPIKTPNAIDSKYLQDYFNEYFDNSAYRYYEQRIAYNNAYIGHLVYQIYQKNSDGSLTLLGNTENNSYVINSPIGGNVTYVIKSSYSIFTYNMSKGLEIQTSANIDSNVLDQVNPPSDNKKPPVVIPDDEFNNNTGLE